MSHTKRQTTIGLTLAAMLAVAFAGVHAQEPVPGQNVNVIGGPTFIELEPFEMVGDPFGTQQVEPHCAVSSRNPAVMVCGAVDYRIVDLDGGAEGGVHLDSWNMVAQSTDGGTTWTSRLHPDHPLDPDPKPDVLTKYDFAADPIWRSGAAGLFLHIGLVANRDTSQGQNNDKPKKDKAKNSKSNGKGPPNPLGAIYSSTWIHLSDKEDDPEPVKLAALSEVFIGNAGQFGDRPDLAVGEPTGGTCTFEVPRGDGGETVTQTIPATPAYLAFTTFIGGGRVKTQINFTKSDDCGQTWTATKNVNKGTGNALAQGLQVVKFPGSEKLLLFWRRGASQQGGDAIMMARSSDAGDTFTDPEVYAKICPFDQGTSATTARARTVPAVAVDENRAYVVWSDRSNADGTCPPLDNSVEARAQIVILTTDGMTWTAPTAVDTFAGPGHQIRPTVAVAAGRVHVAWEDYRNDASKLFQPFIDELPIVINDLSVLPAGVRNRHTADMRAAEADAGADPFPPSSEVTTSHQISQYFFGVPTNPFGQPLVRQQTQFNVVGARNFDKMTKAFHGDYGVITTESMVIDPISNPGVWVVNGTTGAPPLGPVFHRFWTDGRDMKLISNEDYMLPRPYTPRDFNDVDFDDDDNVEELGLPSESLYDPTRDRETCVKDTTGTKNLEIYTSRSTDGSYAFAPWNNKTLLDPDDNPVQRAFPIVVQNTIPPTEGVSPTSFRLSIAATATDTFASFEQFGVSNCGSPDTAPCEIGELDKITPIDLPVLELFVDIPVGSAIARTVFVTSSDPRAAVRVDIERLDESGVVVQTRAVFLNPDRTAPENLLQPGTDEGQANFDISRFEVHDLDISNVLIQDIGLTSTSAPNVATQGPEDGDRGWQNRGWQNPGWDDRGWQNRGWQNPSYTDSTLSTVGWEDRGWQNTGLSDDDAALGSVQISAEYTNTGNTTTTYDARLLVTGVSDELATQLIVYKPYTTTPVEGCKADAVQNAQILVNIADFDVSPEALSGPGQDATFALNPGETAYVVLVVQAQTESAVATLGLFNDDIGASEPENTFVFQGTPDAVDTEDLTPGDPVPDSLPVLAGTGVVRVAVIEASTVENRFGLRAVLQIIPGDLPVQATILDAVTFNGKSVAELRAEFDVLLFAWFSDSPFPNADWNTRLLPYMALGGGIIFEDPAIISSLAPGVVASSLETDGTGIIVSEEVEGLTDAIVDSFVNNHIKFNSWDSDLLPFLTNTFVVGSVEFEEVVGLRGEFPGGGRIVLTGPDQHFHGIRGAGDPNGNQYNLLVNELRWVTHLAP